MLFSLVLIIFSPVIPAVHLPHPHYPYVQLSDATGWMVSPDDARYFWRLSRRHIEHHREYIVARYPFARYQAWIADASHSCAAWDVLDNILHPTTPKDETYILQQLSQLRLLLGEDDYRAKKMPSPCPYWYFE